MLKITTGLPGAGKTTYAQAWVAEDPRSRCRVNRDDLRAMLFNSHGKLDPEQEDAVSAAELTSVAILLGDGMDVIVDATHLTDHSREKWADLAAAMNTDFVVHVLDTPVAECIRRDRARGAQGGRCVGADVIAQLDRGRHRHSLAS